MYLSDYMNICVFLKKKVPKKKLSTDTGIDALQKKKYESEFNNHLTHIAKKRGSKKYLLVEIQNKRFVDRISFAEEQVNCNLHPYVGDIGMVKYMREINVFIPQLYKLHSKNTAINAVNRLGQIEFVSNVVLLLAKTKEKEILKLN